MRVSHFLISKPPGKQIQQISQIMKKGTAPGVNRINVELIVAAHLMINEILEEIIDDAWSKNRLPPTWETRIQVPIPEKKSPKSIEDYRRITLCSVGFKC